MRPSSPLLDSVRDLFEGQEQLARDFARAFQQYPVSAAVTPTSVVTSAIASLAAASTGATPKTAQSQQPLHLFDVTFLVGQGKNKVKLYGVRALLGVRSRYGSVHMDYVVDVMFRIGQGVRTVCRDKSKL
jgi:hypothetical protein